MINESHLNADQNVGTFTRPVHHREVVKGSTVRNDAPHARNQDLAAAQGTDWAKQSFARRRKS